MIHKPIAIMILPLALGGILILAVLTTIPSYNHAFAFGNSFTFASPTSSEDSNSSGSGQESGSSNTGNGQESGSSNAGSGQESGSSNAGNVTTTSVPANVTTTSVPEKATTTSVPEKATTTSVPEKATTTSVPEDRSTKNNAPSFSGFTENDRSLLQQAYKSGYNAGSAGAIDSCDESYGEMVKAKYQCGGGDTPQMCAFPDMIHYCHQGFVAGQHDKETVH
jgi:hypothetical protein